MTAIREDEISAASLGINCQKWKVFAFAISSAVAGAGGCFYASFVGTLVPDAFFITESFTILAMVIVGGMGTLIGPVLGAILLTVLPELLRGIGDLRLIVYGVSVTLVVLFMPGGMVQAVRLIAARLRRRFAGMPADSNHDRRHTVCGQGTSARHWRRCPVSGRRLAEKLWRRASRARHLTKHSGRSRVCHHRAEWRRQIDVTQPYERPLSAGRRYDGVCWDRSGGHGGATARAPRACTNVSENPAVQTIVGAWKRHCGISYPSRHPCLAICHARRGVSPRSDALPRRGDEPADLRRTQTAGLCDRRLAVLWRAAHARNRPRARNCAAFADDR